MNATPQRLTATILSLTDLRYAATANSLEDRCDVERDQSRCAGKGLVFFVCFFFISCHRVHWMHTYQKGKERDKGSQRKRRNLLPLQTNATCRENESECTGKVGLFINVQLRAMQPITSLQSMTLPLCWPLLLRKVSWPPFPRSLMAECE